MSKREAFLLWVLAGLLSWQAGVFTYGLHLCAQLSHDTQHPVCPQIGDRFESFMQTSLGAVLGLLAGSAIQQKPPTRSNREG